ncbi:DNA polymerase/3'-5' exonuclease PolX [Nitrosophilus kaiyonis]|uniref:DNA polymerase/3'-5' exonuclease PolX n=1 Tax=Nitrosophilus kaiyonis TaxID=2930200 RepID=UPI0024934F5A|nr:DNA polymerase/3'-5' exonuclease PolX [Nitrosophilus kaiyonis]
MAITNADIAAIFNKVADLLEIKGENPFKVRAYRNAARTVENIGKSLVDLVNEGYDLTKLPGIGHDLSEYIKEIVTTGKFSKLQKLEKEIPSHLVDMLSIEGLGPKRIKVLYETLHVESMEDLRRAAESGEILKLPGFGPTLVEKILKGIRLAKKAGHRFRIDVAKNYAQDLVNYIKQIDGIIHIDVAGSYRRRKETVGDLDILVTAKDWDKVTEHFVKYSGIKEIVSKGPTRSTVILKSDLQVDLRSVPNESYGAALHYFTGSKAHNIAIRTRGVKLGLKINEYGVFKGEKRVGGEKEEDVFKSVGLPYIEPELRENRGEIEAAEAGKLPKLVKLDDIVGDLHMHTRYTDGKNSIEEMAEAAMKKGYKYIAITDHSKRVTVAKGLDEKRLLEQIEEIDKINEKLKNFTILKGIEVDILEDGSLDLSNDVLKELDVVVGAVHSKFKLSREKQTTRVLKAMDNPYFNILAHPTGRLIGSREGYDIDIEKILNHAKENGCYLEINAQPERLDLNDINAKLAKEMGIKMAISTDAHNIFSLDYMQYGVYQARRGWCEKEDILNTHSLKELKKLLKR